MIRRRRRNPAITPLPPHGQHPGYRTLNRTHSATSLSFFSGSALSSINYESLPDGSMQCIKDLLESFRDLRFETFFCFFLLMLTEFCNVLKVSWRRGASFATTRTDMTPAGSYFWQQFWRSWRCELLLVIFRFAPASQWDLPFKSHHVVATGNAGWHKKRKSAGQYLSWDRN